MADSLRTERAGPARDYPVGVPVMPPPGWRPRPSPPARLAFRAQGALVLKAGLLALLVIVCMGVGWLLSQGRRPGRNRPADLALAQAPTRPNGAGRSAPRRRREASPQRRERSRDRDREKERRDFEDERPAPRQDTPRPKEEPPARPTPTPTPTPPGDPLTYEKHILPIVQRACLSCHGARKKRGGLDLRSYAALVRGGDSGVGVVPGKPNESPLYETIAAGRMPPKRKLPVADRERIREWIARGARSEMAGR